MGLNFVGIRVMNFSFPVDLEININAICVLIKITRNTILHKSKIQLGILLVLMSFFVLRINHQYYFKADFYFA